MHFKKSTYIIILLFSFIFLFSQNKKPIIDYVFLLDTSTSIEGKPEGLGYVDIFNDVKKEINNFIEEIEPPANVFIYEFNAGIQSSNEFEIKSQHDLDDVKNHFLKIKATGTTTYIYRSLEDIIQRMNNYIESRPKEKHSVIIQLFTDGNDKDKHPYTMERVMDYFQQIKKEGNWWIFYTTLGVELTEKDKKIIDKHPEVKHIHSEKGVHPIQIIENKISNLHFGNLWENSTSSQTSLFKLPIKKKLPENVSISVNEEFLNFPNGLGVIVNPDNFIPQKRVDFDIEIIGFNKEKKEFEGLYEFNINLISHDPFVQIVPDFIAAKFLFEPPRIVEIFPSRNEIFPINFGKLNTNEKTEVTVEKKINLLFNNQAVVKGGNITVNWETEKNPTKLTSKNIIINNSKETYIKIPPDIKEMIIKITANKDFKSGKYIGKINFTSEDITISGKELKENKDNPNEKYIMWSFEIPHKQLPLWFWIILIAVVLGIIAYIIYLKLKPPILEDFRLEVIKPIACSIDISDRQQVKFGENGEKFTDAIGIDFKIYVEKVGDRLNAKIRVESGTVFIQRLGEKRTEIFASEDLYGDDILFFKKYEINIISFKYKK